jgi:predicted dehydrogenase
MKRYRVGVLGLTHDHIWGNLDRLVQLPNTELVGAADPHQPLREKFQQRYGNSEVAEDYYDFLDHHELDAVYAFADNRTSGELAIEALNRGLHAMLEKPMAADLELADRMYAAANLSNKKLMINFPHNWNPRIRTVYKLVKEGAVGEVFKLRFAGGHAGPREIGCSPIFCDWLYEADLNGVGALNDQACYGATICRWFLGRPSRVMAMGGRLTKTDISDLDNVVMLLRYDKAIAINESSWSWIGGYPTAGPLVYGTEGSLAALSARDTGEIALIKKGDTQLTEVKADPLPEGERSASEYFIKCIDEDRPIEGLVSPAICRDAQEILEAAVVSIRTGAEVAVPLDSALPGLGYY